MQERPEGLNVAFATTSDITFSPATVPTNDGGMATSNVVIPYGTQIQAVVSGGGNVVATPTNSTVGAPAVTLNADLQVPSSGAPCTTAGPCIVQASASASASVGGGPLQGLPLSFAFTGVLNDAGGGASSTIAGPPSPVLTTSDGGVSYPIVIPAGVTGFTVVVTGGGAATTTSFPAGP